MDPENPPSSSPPSSPPPPAAPPPPVGAPPGPFAQVDPRIRNLAIGLFALALLVLIGTFTSSWATASERGGEMGAGLRGFEACGRGHCVSFSWSDAKAPGDLTLFGYLGLLGGLASVAAAVAIGYFAMTSKPNKIPPKVLNIVLGVTAFAMTAFLIRILTEGDLEKLDMGISYSGILAIGGVIGIGVVSKMLAGLRGGA